MPSSTAGHYVKGSGRGSLPGRFVVLITESATEVHDARTSVASPGRHRRTVVAHCHRSGSGYSRPTVHRFPDPESVWAWLESPRLSGRRTLVVSPVASDSLTLLRFWGRLEAHGCRWTGSSVPGADPSPGTTDPHPYTITRRVLAGSPDILEYTVLNRRFRWLSGRNFYRDSESEIAAATGYQWESAAEGDDSAGVRSADPADRAKMWLHAMTTLALWWRDRHAGPFPMTLAGMGYAYLKSRLPPKTVCTHRDDGVIRLERSCCHGGRATLWYVGDVRDRGRHTKTSDLPFPSSGGAVIKGPIHHVDIRSMYPFLMREREFPIKFYTQYSDVSPPTLADMLSIYHGVARVSLDTDRAEYPYRSSNRVIYPVGRFGAYLTTPDLLAALSHGAVTKVHHVALYYKGRPFRQSASEMLDMRSVAEAEGNRAHAKFVKSLANSCTGKLAQRKYLWKMRKDIRPEQQWGSWYDDNGGRSPVTMFRAMNGLVEERCDDAGGTGTLTAAYATLTAYGRVMMREIRERLPCRTVISQDTDGMWVTDAGYSQIAREHGLIGESAGLLRLVQSVSNARFWTPQHYNAGGSWTLAGFCEPVCVSGSAAFYDVSVVNPVRSACLGPPSEVVTVRTLKTLDSNKADGIHGDDGWMTPYRLPGGIPTPIQPPPPPSSLFG